MTFFLFFLFFCASALLSPLVAFFGVRTGVVDLPGGRRAHIGVVPRVGGIAVFLPFLCALPFLTSASVPYLPLAIGVGGLCLLGALDDALTLSAIVRLVAEGALCTMILSYTFPSIRALSFFASLFFLLALINGANFLDGMDALLLSLALPPLFALALTGNQAAPIALAVFALLLGFLPWNLPHARIFLGDSGSTTLGFLLGYLALISFFTAELPYTADAPIFAFSAAESIFSAVSLRSFLPALRLILLFFVFFLDLTLTVGGRLLRGTSPFAPDRTHIHHRLITLVGEKRTRRLLFSLSLTTALFYLITA